MARSPWFYDAHMPDVPEVLDLVLRQLCGLGELRTRKMFGGRYIYCDGLFFACIHDDTLYFKANARTAPEFIARGLPAFSYPKDGGIATLQYYQAPPEVFQRRDTMLRWARKALLVARQDAKQKAGKTRSAGRSAPRAKTAARRTRQ